MSLNSEDKTIVLYISVLFLFIVALSFLISFFSLKTEVHFDLIDMDLINKSNYTFEDFDDMPSFFDENELELTDEKESLVSSSELNIFSYEECTPIMNFNEFVKINKRYRFNWDNVEFFVSERFSSSKNGIYEVIVNQHINYEGFSHSFKGEYYYDEKGDCLRIFFDMGSDGTHDSFCSGKSFSFVCKEMYEDLNYSGEQIYYTYGKEHTVNVYSNEDESIVLKYGKDVPILFYLRDYTSRNIKIELIGLEVNV